jgi:hypothetical protein
MFAAGARPEVDAFELANHIAATTHVSDASGFPGLPQEAGSTERFERILAEIAL